MSLTRRLAAIAADVEEEHAREVNELHDRLQTAETERMQAQLACLRLEASLEDGAKKCLALEGVLHETRDENARLRCSAVERTVEAAQLARINDLSRELIATRFRLASVSRRLPSLAGAGSGEAGVEAELADLGMDALLDAATRLDLLSADSILNPACLLTRPASEAKEVVTDGESEAASPSSAESEGATRDAGSRDVPSVSDALSASLSNALLAVLPCGERSREAAREGGEEAESGAAADMRRADASCALIEALLLRGASVNATDRAGRTPLHGACDLRLASAGALLLHHGAAVDARDDAGATPMHLAASAGSGELVELLLRHGADDSLPRFDGATPAQLATAHAATSAPAAAPPEGRSAAAALQDDTLRLSAMARRASAHYRHARYAEAERTFEAALELAQRGGAAVCSAADVATLHFNCARAALKEGRHVNALEQASKALECKPDYANAAMLQAECHMELLDFEAAAAAYRRVSALEPTNMAWEGCAARAASMAAASAYEVLGVGERAESAEIKRAYHTLCLQWHPDKHQNSAEDRRRANSMFQRVTGAYEQLSDARSRTELDARLRTDAALRRYRSSTEAEAPARRTPSPRPLHPVNGQRSSSSHGHHQPVNVDDLLNQKAFSDARYDGYDGGYDGGYEPSFEGIDVGGYGGGEDLRPPSYVWRWPSASPWFEADAELS